MARFQVFELGTGGVLALDLQSNLLDGLNTRVVAPLVPIEDVGRFAEKLNPRFTVGEKTYLMMTEHIGALPVKELGPVIADLSAQRDRIVAATDFLFQGF